MKAILSELLQQVASTLLPAPQTFNILLERPKSTVHGDFSTNIAMQLAKSLKQNPHIIAEKIISALSSHPSFATAGIDKIEIAGAGFVNFFLTARARQAIVSSILKAGANYGTNQNGQNRLVQVEFVSANPTGPLHVGHGRGAAVGDCLCRLLEANGWQVTREFYYNDAGAQIDNLSKSVQARAKGVTPESDGFPEDGYRGDYILEIAQAYLVKAKVSADNLQITASDDIEDLEAIRGFAVAYLRREQDLDLKAFQIQFDVFSLESDLYRDGKVEQTVQALINSGHTYQLDGALWLKTTDFGDDKDRVMLKKEGGYTYFVPDVAYHLQKWKRGFVRVINEQGADHHSTITRVRAGLQALNVNIPQGWPEYVLHQMVTVMRGGEEVKLSKRSGSYVTLRDLIDEVGCDATRYFLAARSVDSQLVFDIDLARSQTNDNPVYYIQYAHARICSVLSQWSEAEVDTLEAFKNADLSCLNNEAETLLMQKLDEYIDVVETACQLLAPHMVANYLKELASALHSYYNDTKFLVADESVKLARLALISATRVVLANGLALLGVSAPLRMSDKE